MSPRISLVVPFYDVDRYIGACLGSIRHQTLRSFEVILVDDGSTDQSADIADEVARRDRRFRVVRQPNRGLGPARNSGAAEASGDYLMFVDSDDLLPPRALQTAVERLDATGSALAVGNARRFDSATVTQSWGQIRSAGRDRNAVTVMDMPALAADRIACNKVFRRTFWESAQFAFPAMRYEDYPVVLAALIEAQKIDCVRTPIYYWRHRDDRASITQRSADVDNALDRIRSAECVLDLADRRAPSLRPEVHNLLARIDVPAVLSAFASQSDAVRNQLLPATRRFVDRLDTDAIRPQSGFLAIQLDALGRSDADALAALAQHRRDRGPDSADRSRRSPTRPWRRSLILPGAGSKAVQSPARLYLVPYWRHRLETMVESLRFTDDALVVRARAHIAFATPPSSIRVMATSGAERVPGRLVRTDETGFEVRFDAARLATEPTWSFEVECRAGWMRRRSALHADDLTRAPTVRFGGPGGGALRVGWDEQSRLVVGRTGGSPVATSGAITASTITVELGGDPPPWSISATDPQGDSVVESTTARRQVDLDLVPLLEDVGALDPATGVAHYALVDSVTDRAVLSAALVAPVYATVGGRLVGLTRTGDGVVAIEVASNDATATTLAPVSDGLLVAGVGAGDAGSTFSWRSATDGVSIESVGTTEGERWEVVTGAAEIGTAIGSPETASVAVLYAGDRPVRLDGFAAAELPVTIDGASRPVVVCRRGSSIEARWA